ncbi:MAG: hypothetical protein JJ877_03615 [Thalassococcus sp.]|uniref:hypothetical protein n=1 Tax=Thalassococcus sp. TaxID=1928858 RepID=UPI001AFD201C|nr:hypothetical protein [Thalassococcus sp.]MBO6866107.1 hypothetical protein [Thalassococcus sp.]
MHLKFRLARRNNKLDITPSRSSRLLHLKEEAKNIREKHTAGEISAEEAARQLRALQRSSLERRVQPISKGILSHS